MVSVFKRKQGRFYSLVYGIISLVAVVAVYVIATPIMDKLLAVGEDLLSGNTKAMELLLMIETLWHKATIPILIVSIVIYMLVSAYRKEPYQYQ